MFLFLPSISLSDEILRFLSEAFMQNHKFSQAYTKVIQWLTFGSWKNLFESIGVHLILNKEFANIPDLKSDISLFALSRSNWISLD